MDDPTTEPPSARPVTLVALRGALASTLEDSRSDVPEGRPAAVAAIFREVPEGLDVLLIRRADRKGDPWSGHMAFPGGRYEAQDSDLLRTAVRETMEEVGLDLDLHANLLGVLPDQNATLRRKGPDMPIRPYVFELHRAAEVRANEEVNEIIWVPIHPMMRGAHKSSIEVDIDQVRYTLPAYDIDGRIVWGLTYRMLQTLFGLFASP